jgi:biotin synthase
MSATPTSNRRRRSNDPDGRPLDHAALERWLREDDPARLDALYTAADLTRREHVGDAVHLRGLIELSNICSCRCSYCGIGAELRELRRYRLDEAQVMQSAARAVDRGYGTLVLQAGEDAGLEVGWVARLIERLRRETGLAISLSLGHRPEAELARWREAGADRYLARFETTDPELYAALHPHAPDVGERVGLLRRLRHLGYQVGSGMLVGLPGQSYASLARDLLLLHQLGLQMVGLGPFLAHPDTPLGRGEGPATLDAGQQVPASAEMTCKAVALARLLLPEAHIPSTTALATLGAEARASGLCRGANVVMPNVGPPELRALYAIYPAKGRVDESLESFDARLRELLADLGRRPGEGHGHAAR